MKRSLLAAAMAATLLLAGCASNKTVDPYAGNNPEYIYATGHTMLQKGDYSDAIAAFQSLDSQYPFGQYTKMGDLELIYAQYKDDDPALALASANRFIQLYPSDSNLAYAYYMRGVINFDNGRSFLERYTPYDMAKHDPVEYKNAYQDFTTVITQYPNSPYVQDARRRMMYLVNTMAQYQLDVATYYYQMKAYVAAVRRAKTILIEYPQTPQLQGALVVMLQSYEQLNLPDLVASTRLLLKANFPNNSLVQTMAMPPLQSANAASAQPKAAVPSNKTLTKTAVPPVSVKVKPLVQPPTDTQGQPVAKSANPK